MCELYYYAEVLCPVSRHVPSVAMCRHSPFVPGPYSGRGVTGAMAPAPGVGELVVGVLGRICGEME